MKKYGWDFTVSYIRTFYKATASNEFGINMSKTIYLIVGDGKTS